MKRPPIALAPKYTGIPIPNTTEPITKGETSDQIFTLAPDATSQTQATSLTRPPLSKHPSSAMSASTAKLAAIALITPRERWQRHMVALSDMANA
jgi:hypothetical protein